MQNVGHSLSHVKALDELGPLPNGNDSIQEILLLDIGRPFSNNQMVVFGKINRSGATDTMFVDRTFKMAQAIFRQIFTIHIRLQNTSEYASDIFALLPKNKLEATYTQILN